MVGHEFYRVAVAGSAPAYRERQNRQFLPGSGPNERSPVSASPADDSSLGPYAHRIRVAGSYREAGDRKPPAAVRPAAPVDVAGGLAVRLVQGEAGTETSTVPR